MRRDVLKDKLQKIWSKDRNRRTKKEVETLRTEGAVFGGCCGRFADNQACDCLELATGSREVPYHPRLPVHTGAVTIYLGIDPGSNGGLAALREDGSIYALTRMPSELPKLLAWFELFEGLSCSVLLEQVSGYIGVAHPGSSMFEFGRGVGHLEMAMTATGLEWDTILPQRWQRGLGLRTKEKKESDTQWKSYLRSEAAKRFTRIKVTKATADALLIAWFTLHTKGKVKE